MQELKNAGLGLPHARGGVSAEDLSGALLAGSSPRPWGCFREAEEYDDPDAVFPTPVGVFLDGFPYVDIEDGLPHARGGVSHLHSRL